MVVFTVLVKVLSKLILVPIFLIKDSLLFYEKYTIIILIRKMKNWVVVFNNCNYSDHMLIWVCLFLFLYLYLTLIVLGRHSRIQFEIIE